MAARSGPFPQLAALSLTVFLAIVIFGCGGGGGGSNSTSSSSTGVGVATDIQPILLFKGTQTPASPFVSGNPQTYNFQLVPGDQAQVVLIGVNSVTQQPQEVSGSNFQIDAPSTVATETSRGLISALAASPSLQFHASATYQGTVYTSDFQVVAPTAKVAGVVNDTSGNEIANVTISFYDSSGTLQAQTVTGADGSFKANVPTVVKTFVADASALTVPSYYNEYEYNNFYYSTLGQACYTPVSGLAVGSTTTLPTTIVVLPNDSGNPPPPPTGCGQ